VVAVVASSVTELIQVTLSLAESPESVEPTSPPFVTGTVVSCVVPDARVSVPLTVVDVAPFTRMLGWSTVSDTETSFDATPGTLEETRTVAVYDPAARLLVAGAMVMTDPAGAVVPAEVLLSSGVASQQGDVLHAGRLTDRPVRLLPVVSPLVIVTVCDDGLDPRVTLNVRVFVLSVTTGTGVTASVTASVRCATPSVVVVTVTVAW